ncbi:F-box only protein 4 [Balamuthia mandrillaris]
MEASYTPAPPQGGEEEGEGFCLWQELSAELVLCVLSFMGPAELAVMCRLNHDLKLFAEDSLLWKQRFVRQFGSLQEHSWLSYRGAGHSPSRLATTHRSQLAERHRRLAAAAPHVVDDGQNWKEKFRVRWEAQREALARLRRATKRAESSRTQRKNEDTATGGSWMWDD